MNVIGIFEKRKLNLLINYFSLILVFNFTLFIFLEFCVWLMRMRLSLIKFDRESGVWMEKENSVIFIYPTNSAWCAGGLVLQVSIIFPRVKPSFVYKKILLLWLQASFSWFQCLLTASYTCAGNSAQCVANIVFRNSGNCLQKWKLPVLFLSQKKLDPTVWIEKLPLFNFKYFRFFFCRALKFVIYLFLVTPRMRTGEHLR